MRLVKPEEIEQLRQLLIDSYSFDYDLNEGYKADILDVESRLHTSNNYVIEENGELVATVSVPYEDEKVTEQSLPNEMDFRQLAVSPKHRRKGYASKIIKNLEEIARKRGYKKLMLVTGPEMKTAQNLYHALGFEQPKERETYIPSFGITLLIFIKEI
ncbi:MAG: GNAT family N-acetyltransferase [Micrococcaceae bacterium]